MEITGNYKSELTGQSLRSFAAGVTNNISGGDPIGDGLRADVKAYWKMDEASGNRLDSSGNGHHFDTFTGTVGSAAGKVDNAVTFINPSYMSCPSHTDLSGSGDFSIAMWTNIDFLSLDVGTLFAKGEDISTEYAMFANVGGIDTYIDFSTDGGLGLSSATFSADEWHFIVAWKNETAQKIYIQVDDGTIQEGDLPGPYAVYDPLARVSIGAVYLTEPGSFLDGRVDEVGFWKRVLTTEERSYLYNSGNGRSLYP